MAKEPDRRATRKHAILAERLRQLHRNELVDAGGEPYINARLSKFPSESNLSWEGSKDGEIKSRKERAALVNYASRIVTKIVQLIFAQDVPREGIDPDFAQDATKTNESITAFFKEACRAYITGQWAWIQVDRGSPGMDPSTGLPSVRSVQDRLDAGDRIFFSLWRSTEVVDWRFDTTGSLSWLLSQETLYDNEDPEAEAKTQVVRTLWTPGGGTRLYLKSDNAHEIEREEPFTLSANIIPWVLIGKPSAKPHWFDDAERVQASLLQLESAHDENLLKGVFPQLVISTGLIDEIMAKSGRSFDDAIELVRGIEYPLFETAETNGLTRIISPDSGAIDPLPNEIMRRRKELFEIAGQALKSDSKQVQSAESKAWDNRDIEATLADHADTLEDAERKAVAKARLLDTSFPEYVPKYPRTFDLPDIDANMRTALELEQSANVTPTMLKQIMRVKVKGLSRMLTIDPEVLKTIDEEIDAMQFDNLDAIAASVVAEPAI